MGGRKLEKRYESSPRVTATSGRQNVPTGKMKTCDLAAPL
jgi:hypothetical protein